VLVNGKKEMEMCDLLEVYSSSEKETLKRTHGVYMKESEFSRPASTAATAESEETLQFVDMDTLRYQKIASQKVETIRLKAEQRKTSNNVVDQSAFYSDIESDDDDDDDGESSDGDNKNDENNKNSSNESEEEESEEEEKVSKTQKQNTWNKNKRVYKEEIDVDDI
jgi:Skp family chaperone for outer membrane proteins